MNLAIPPSLSSMSPVIVEFFESMLHKLDVNSHKNAITDDDIDGLLAKLAEEIQEFRVQRIQDADDPNMLAELADTANFAFLLYAFLRERGVQTVKERFLNEFFDVDVDKGLVLCKKTRAGSPLKVGDTVGGSLRGGKVYIRSQHTISGATVYVARRDIVWWKATGKWPDGPLFYVDEDAEYIDGKDNLEMYIDTREKSVPFVTQYKPRGRENNQNHGKWRYQRRHMFKLVSVGYWDTQDEAASEGLKAWKEKTRNV